MWTTSEDGIEEMLDAAESAVVGMRREDALDAANDWIGAAIRALVIQTIGESDVVVHERTHASGMTRSGERLIVPNTSWTVVSHQAFNPADGPLRVRIEKSDDSTRFFELPIGPGEAGSISGAAGPDDTLALDLEITAFNIPDPGEIPAPPADFAHRIYDNIDAPVSVQPSLVGMHFTDADSLGGPAFPPQIAVPGTQPSAISMSQPAFKTATDFGSLGTKVTRITDANNQFHHYATWPAFNADGSRVLINTSSGANVLDTSDWSQVRSVSIGAVVCFFDPANPDIIWGHDGHGGGNGIYRYSVSANTSTRYAISGYTGISIGMGEGSMSADGRYIILCGTQSGNSDVHLIVWDTTTNSVSSSTTLSGWTYSGSSFDNAHISPSGNYVIVSSYHAGSRGHRIYDRATLTFQRAYTGGSGTNGSNGFPGHMDVGYRTNGDECMVRQNQAGALVSVRLSDGNERVEVPASAMTWAWHVSCRNILRPGYAYLSMVYISGGTSAPLFREVCAVRLDGSQSIERWGQAMFPSSDNYATQAKATVSPDGKMILMTSGWGTTTAREYVIHWPSAGADPGYGYDTFRTFDCPPLAWSAIETSDNNFSWTAADTAINAAYAAGKRILFVIWSPPSFHVSTGPYPDGNWPALTRFVEQIMVRYAGKLWAVQWWSNPSRTTMLAEWAQGQVRTYRAVKAADPNVLVFLGGFRPSGDSILSNDEIVAMGTTVYDGTEARNAGDILSFQSFGATPAVTHALARFRSLAATRAAMRPALLIAMDMCGADATAGAGFAEADHIKVIQQLLLLGVGYGARLVGLYAHERTQEIGQPSTNANIRTAIDDIYSGAAGKSMVRAYVMTDGTVWIAFSDGTTLQSPGGTYVPPEPDPEDPDRDLRVHPFAINDVTNIKIGSTSVYADTNDLATNLVRASVGLNGHVGPSSQNPTPQEWSIPRYIGTASDPILNVRVYAPNTNPANGTVVSVRCPANARPSRPWRPSDGHFCVINGNTIHEFWHCEPPTSAHPNEWHASSYTPAPLDGASWGYHLGFGGNHTIPGMLGWGSTRAFGGSQNFGLIMPAELEAGLIPHVIGFAQRMQDFSTTNAPGSSNRWVWPATRDDGGGSYTQGANGVRQGQCFAIPKSFDIEAQSWIPYVKTIARALRDYGAICIDQSGSTCCYLELTTRTSAMYAITDTDNFRNQLRAAWSQLRRVTNHTQATPKGNL